MKDSILLNNISRFIMAATLISLVLLIAHPVLASDKYYTNDRVNFRTGPGTEYERLKTLPIGTEVEVLEHDVELWSKVIYKEQTGYIKSEFLDVDRPDNAPEISPEAVVLMPWQEAQNVVRIGVNISVYDVRSGLTYNVKSFSNGAHADVEPVTTEDTAIMKRTYGGVWSWDPRSVWVTVGSVTIAAAINGMPHGGGINPNNGMQGQVCLHFKGSSVHNGNRSYNSRMQAAVQAAFDAAL